MIKNSFRFVTLLLMGTFVAPTVNAQDDGTDFIEVGGQKTFQVEFDIDDQEPQTAEILFNEYQQVIVEGDDYRQQGYYYFEDGLLALSLTDSDGNNVELHLSYDLLDADEVSGTIEDVTLIYHSYPYEYTLESYMTYRDALLGYDYTLTLTNEVPSHTDLLLKEPEFHNADIEVPSFDPEEANRILDEAGYEDVDGDGFRETPDGEPLQINFASMSGGDTAEPLANYYIQSWRGIGLDVSLIDGRLIEYNAFYDMLDSDHPDIDVFLAGWNIGTDVDQSALYGHDAPYNYIRYASEENTQLINEGSSSEALDIDYRIQVYNDWQELMVEEVVVIPTLYRSGVHPVSTDVVNYSVELGFNEDYHLYRWGLSE